VQCAAVSLVDISRQICGSCIIYTSTFTFTALVPRLGDLSHLRYAFALYVLFLVVAIAVRVAITVYVVLCSGHSRKFSLPSVYLSPFPLILLLVKMRTFL